MKIIINGEQKNIAENSSISKILNELGYQNSSVAIALNNSFVPKEQLEKTIIQENDSIEILTPMQGG